MISLRNMLAILDATASLIGKAEAYLEQYSINVKAKIFPRFDSGN
jgi:hypothetical protein